MSTNQDSRLKSISSTVSIAICAIALFVSGCDINLDFTGIQGSGVETTKSFDIDAFDQVRFSGSGEYNISCGEEQSVSVTIDDNLMEFVDLNVEDGKLKFNVTEQYTSGMGLKVDITIPKLKGVEVNGAGTATIKNVSAEAFAIDVSGASTVVADGSANSLDLQASGACSLKLYELESKKCTVDMSGAGSAMVHVTEMLDAKISGVGSVKYKGEPEVKKDVSGIGSVSKMQ